MKFKAVVIKITLRNKFVSQIMRSFLAYLVCLKLYYPSLRYIEL